MKTINVADGVHVLTTNVEGILFEEMWEMPKGVTLNSYVVKGEKAAIIDGFCAWDGVPETLYKLLEETGVKPEDIDYAIINHMEPDHSGWIEDFKKLNDHFKIYTNKKAADILNIFYGYVDNVVVIKDGDTLDLGGGKELLFKTTPNVHWPDTMVTLEQSTGTLFTCDMYGTFGKMESSIFADEIPADEKEELLDEEIRYYSNVLATFNKPAQKAIAKARELEPKIIAPGHGPIYRKNPEEVLDRYEKITKFSDGEALEEVAIIWGSMYGMTEKAVENVKEQLDEKGVKYNDLHLPHVSDGEVLSKAIRSKYWIIAAPTYEMSLLPSMAHTLDELARKKIDNKKCIYFGSFGWGSKVSKELPKFVEESKMKWEILDMLQFKGALDKEAEERIKDAVNMLLNA